MREPSMSLLLASASAMASFKVSGVCSAMSTPTRSAEGSGRAGASKFGAMGGGSVGSSAGAMPPETPTPCPGVCCAPAAAPGVVAPGVVPCCGGAVVPAGVAVCGCPGTVCCEEGCTCGEGGRGPCVLGVVCCLCCSTPVCGCVLCCASFSGLTGAAEEFGGNCVVGAGGWPGLGCCGVVPAGGDCCGVEDGGVVPVRLCPAANIEPEKDPPCCASAAPGATSNADATSDADTTR